MDQTWRTPVLIPLGAPIHDAALANYGCPATDGCSALYVS